MMICDYCKGEIRTRNGIVFLHHDCENWKKAIAALSALPEDKIFALSTIIEDASSYQGSSQHLLNDLEYWSIVLTEVLKRKTERK